MANTLIINGAFTINSDTVRSIGSMQTNVELSGQNYVAENLNVTSSEYRPLQTGSLDNMAYGYFSNPNATGSIIVALDDSGTDKVAVLRPKSEAVWQYSGSIDTVPLYAAAVDTDDEIVFEYILTEE